MKLKKSKTTYLYIISFVLIFLYPLRHVHLGVDLWDGGYNYANFVYNDLKYMDSMWYFATWTANTFGNFLTRLPWADTMLGMNVYTGLLVSVMAVASYLFCVRRLHMPAWLVFVGEILAIALCWAPTAILYNYLTYGLFLAGTLFLYQGLTTGKNRYLVLAGAALGLNVGVRFSNLVQVGLILAVWYYAFICKKKFSKVLQETGFCILGYVGAFGLFLTMISVRYGLGNYVEGVKRLFAMTEHATDYSSTSMLLGMVKAYTEDTSTYWMKRFALAGAICLAICFLLPKGWGRVKQILTGAITVAFMAWILKSGYCTGDYATYNSIYYPCIMILLMAVALSLLQIFGKNVDKNEKLQAVLVPLIIYLTSLGGNNAIYSSMNNLFFVLPCFLWMVYRFIKEKEHILYFPFKTFLVASVLLLLVQGILFGNGFVYERATGARDLSAEITEVPILKGMHTSAEKAKELEDLYSYLKENDLLGRECILYGDIPGISYYMELPPAINIWSDLRSYGRETMLTDLEKIAAEIQESGEYPIVIFNSKYTGYYSMGDEQYLPEEATARQKMIDVCYFLDQQGYSHTASYASENYVIFLK